jgi:tetratricopeptide (TPR) repeat protein
MATTTESEASLPGGGDRIDELLREATQLWRRRENPTSLLEISLELLELEPDLAPPLVYAGWCYEQPGLENLGLALELYLRSLQRDLRGDRREFAERRVSYLASRVRREREELEIASAIESIQSAGDATMLARALREAGRLTWALRAHARAVELAVNSDEKKRALTSWAATCRDVRDYEEALRLADQALELDGSPRSNGPAHAVRIAALCDLGEQRNAVIWGELALKTVPRDPYILRAMGRAYRLILKEGFKPSIADQADQCFLDALKYGGSRAVLPELRGLLELYRDQGQLDRIPKLEAAIGMTTAEG